MLSKMAGRPRVGRSFPACASLAQPTALFLCALFLFKVFTGSSHDASNQAPQTAQLSTGGGSVQPGPLLDVGQPPLLAGLQQKSGPLSVLTQLADVASDDPRAREALYYPEEWVQQRLRGRRQPPVARVASVLISHKYKLLFVKCTKTAGTSFVKAFFRLAGCTGTDAAACPVLRIIDYSSAAAVQSALAAWPDYFVATFSRNVLSRAVSQYQYLTTLMDPGCPALSWDQYCEDPYSLGDLCGMKSPAGRPCCVPNAQHHYQHASPQAHCLTTADGGLAVDWVGRVEAFEDDLAALVDLLNARPGASQLLRPAELDPPLARLNHNAGDCQEGEGEGEAGGEHVQLDLAAGSGADSSEGGRNGSVTIRIRVKGGASSSSSGGGGDATTGEGALSSSRRLRFFSTMPKGAGGKLPPDDWEPRSGTLNPCDKNSMFQARHAHCLATLSRFYQEDMRLLHGMPG